MAHLMRSISFPVSFTPTRPLNVSYEYDRYIYLLIQYLRYRSDTLPFDRSGSEFCPCYYLDNKSAYESLLLPHCGLDSSGQNNRLHYRLRLNTDGILCFLAIAIRVRISRHTVSCPLYKYAPCSDNSPIPHAPRENRLSYVSTADRRHRLKGQYAQTLEVCARPQVQGLLQTGLHLVSDANLLPV